MWGRVLFGFSSFSFSNYSCFCARRQAGQGSKVEHGHSPSPLSSIDHTHTHFCLSTSFLMCLSCMHHQSLMATIIRDITRPLQNVVSRLVTQRAKQYTHERCLSQSWFICGPYRHVLSLPGLPIFDEPSSDRFVNWGGG